MPFNYCPNCGRQNVEKKYICPRCGFSLNDGTFVMNGDVLVKYKGNESVIEIPDIVKVIGKEAFSNNNNIVSVNIPNTVTKISDHGFAYCKNLKDIKLSDSVEIIEKYAFIGCAIESISLPKKIVKIEESTFESCTKLQSIIIPDNVKTIGLYVFRYCHSLVSITYPRGIYDVGGSLTYVGCDSLININYRGPKNIWRYINKPFDLREQSPATVVHCEDGDIAI